MKRALLAFILIFSVTAHAENTTATPAPDSYYSSGYIVGLNLGEATTQVKNTADYKKQDTGFAGRIYAGYNLNYYFAVQLGYLILPQVKLTKAEQSNITVHNTGFDLLFTGRYPIGEGFSLYGNVGGAMLSAKKKESGVADVNQNATVLAYGGGIDYTFANIGGLHSIIDYYHTENKNTSTLNVPAEDMYSAGVYYQF